MKKRILSNGIEMPCMAIGTNWMTYKELKPIIKAGFEAGFRAVDTARDYGNEPIVGAVVKDVLREMGMKRSDIFITTKIGNSQQISSDFEKQLEISLENLQTDYIDLWLLHWPYPDFYQKSWKAIETIYQQKRDKVYAIGVANFQERHFRQLFDTHPTIVPMVNQMEFHPLRTCPSLVNYMNEHRIILEAYAPLCRLVSPLRTTPVLTDLQNKYNKSIGQIILRWHIQQGSIPVFKSYRENRFTENVAIFDFELTKEEMSAISSLNIDYKYHLESASCPGY